MSSVKQLEGTTMKGDNHETRIALLEQSTTHINSTLKEIKDELKEIRKEIKEVRTEIKDVDKRVDARLDTINSKIDSTTKWLLGIGVSVLLSFIGIALNFAAQLYLKS
jgi:predicted  nucleic acid-binding Zn-ribbon protein